MLRVCYLVLLLNIVHGYLWKNGIVHYAINSKDYDLHSQEIISTTLSRIQGTICVKFFQSSSDFNTTAKYKILYISNPHKRKTCSPNVYDFNSSVVIVKGFHHAERGGARPIGNDLVCPASTVACELSSSVVIALSKWIVVFHLLNSDSDSEVQQDMTIGYKCLNPRDVARIVTEMLGAGVDSTSSVANSCDLVDRYEKEPTKSLITTEESKYINSLYKTECGLLTRKVSPSRRAMNIEDSIQLSAANLKYYSDKLWPLGIVLYGVDEKLVNTEDFNALKRAMNTIQQSTCVVFQEIVLDDVLLPKSYVWFEEDGEDMPELGFVERKQSVKLSSMVVGAAGHTAHAVNNLLRVMGVSMMSNRFDRDNYVIIHWSNVETGKERYLEKDPEDAWFTHIPYDFDSVTHAPANYMCSHCELGQLTMQPIQDKLWQRTLSMEHTTKLSESDVKLVNMLYGAKCSVN